MERLAELGVTTGCATGPARYCPHDSVTRAQMATFLTRAFDLDPASSFGFVDTEGNTHVASIDALAAAGVTAGCATGPPGTAPTIRLPGLRWPRSSPGLSPPVRCR